MHLAPLTNPGGELAELALLQSGFRYALSLAHHRQDAEDLTQEAWMKLCQRYGAATSRAALFTSIRNLFIDRCRRAKVVAFDSWDSVPTSLAHPESIAPGTRPDLEKLLAALRPVEREAIYLHYVEGHTADEVGTLTRQSRGTVLSLIHRAFHKLRTAANATNRPPAEPRSTRNQ
ncbi:MAG: RNA polymerase sigma factor [Opitutus sp.]